MLHAIVNNESETCECCGESGTDLDLIESKLEYKHNGKIVEIDIKLPVYTCSVCEFQYTAEEAEEIKTRAICKYLDILSPSDICAVREKYSMSKVEFAEMTGVGVASLSRWELGTGMPTKAYSNYLWLLNNGENVEALKDRRSISDSFECNVPTFICIQNVSPEIRQRASNFKL